MFHVNDEPEGKFLFTEKIKLYCTQTNFILRLPLSTAEWAGHRGGSGADVSATLQPRPWQ